MTSSFDPDEKKTKRNLTFANTKKYPFSFSDSRGVPFFHADVAPRPRVRPNLEIRTERHQSCNESEESHGEENLPEKGIEKARENEGLATRRSTTSGLVDDDVAKGLHPER